MTSKNKGCSLVLPTGAVMVAIAALTFHPAQARADDLSWLPAQAQVEAAIKIQPVVNAAAARLDAAAATQAFPPVVSAAMTVLARATFGAPIAVATSSFL